LTLFESALYNPATTQPHHPARGTTPIGSRRLVPIRRAFDPASLVVAARLISLAPFVSVTALAADSSGRTAVSPFSPERVRTLTQDLHGATFEYVPGEIRFDTLSVSGLSFSRVTVAGSKVGESPGNPALPTATLYVGVPDGMSPRLTIVGEDWNERAGPPPPVPVRHQRFVSDDPAHGPVTEFRVEPNPEVYGRTAIFPSRSAYLTRGGAVGELWVVPIQVRPVRWDPAARVFHLLRRMSLRVDFVPATATERAQRPAFRPGGDSGFWGRVQRGMVRNYESARSFPIRPAAAPRPAARARSGFNPQFKLLVAQSGWTSVSYTTLSAAGFPPGIPIATIGVTQRSYDDVADVPTETSVAVVARDANGNGTFDSGDAIAFYARSLADRLGATSIENRYTSTNVYWLTWSGANAAAADSVSGAIAGSPITPSSFLDTIHLEQNRYLLSAPSPGVTSPPEAVPYIFWTRGDDLDNNDVFETTIPFVDPDPTKPFRIRSYYQGQNNFQHHLDLFYQSSAGVTDTLGLNRAFFHQDVYVFDSDFTIPGSHMGPNTGPGNRYRHVGTRQPPDGGDISPGSRAWLDWVEVTYPRLYRAVGNSLTFGSGTALGLVEMTVTSFSAPGIEVYDVTDPLAPLRVTGITIAGVNPYSVTFRTDASGGERRFVALVPGSEITIGSERVAEDSPSHLSTQDPFLSTSLARTIIIAPESFISAASAPVTRLADYRRGQGYVVQVAGIQDVYDEFNGGLKSPLAIRRYMRHAYLAWTPRLMNALLIGDASMDYRHDLPTSSVDLVPTYFKFEAVFSSLGQDLVANESWYSRELNLVLPVDGEDMPSIVLSRIPAGTPQDLDAFVTKVIAYENFQPTDTWRGRMLLASDDMFSTGLFSSFGYCYNSLETFLGANQTFALIGAGSTGGQDMTPDFYDLHAYTDPVPATPDPFGCKNLTSVVNALGTTGGGYSALVSKLTQGGLILNFESHANRYVIAHEVIYCTGSPRGGCPTGSPGPGDFNNVGRPFFGMVWGCHSNQFADGPVLAEGSVDSSDAIGEQWLLLNNRGTIGSLGSTAYELVDQNSNFSQTVADAFFTIPPAPGPTSPRQVRWILGEVFAFAQLTNGLSFDPSQSAMNHTVNLLADPMLRMDALPPRVFEVQLDGTTVQDGGLLVTDSPADSAQVVAKMRDEVAIRSAQLTEQDLLGGPAVPIDSTGYAVAYSDSSRQATLTAHIRPRIGNYDVQIRATDLNGRTQLFTLQVRTPVHYFANTVEIVNGVFVASGARVRADVTTPIPVTADSLELLLDGVSIPVSKTGGGRQWSLDGLPGFGPGTHTLQIAVNGRTAGFQLVTFQVSAEFTMRGVAVVSPKVQGAGCGGSIFQYELSSTADKVELLLMTVAGRRVSSIRMPGNAGFNVYCWDGRDSQGHDTAMGVYLFRIRAADPTGRTVTQDGRMIRTR
jgi:peptidase C25-like protein/flagellar hook capping protein FlgD